MSLRIVAYRARTRPAVLASPTVQWYARDSILRWMTLWCTVLLTLGAQGPPTSSTLRTLEGFSATIFAESPQLESPVGIDVTADGRLFVTSAKRRKTQKLDIRNNRDWLESELQLTSVAAKRAFYERVLAPEASADNAGRVADHDGNGTHDYRDLGVLPDRIYELVDSDRNGQADQAGVFTDDLRGVVSGVAAGVLEHDGTVYVTQCPDVWAFDVASGEKRSLATGFGVHVAYAGHNMHGLTMGPGGRLYWSIGDIGSDYAPFEGAVFRCELDGTDLEVFARGLRNPQELAFNDFGDWFTPDNDGDFGDRERWYHLVEGVDCGWRSTHQYQSPGWGSPTGAHSVWMEDRLWEIDAPERPAYVHPPFGLIADGPCGVATYPGVGFPAGYEGSYFVSHFTGSARTSQVRRYTFDPDGATWRLATDEAFLSEVAATGLDFGPDGALFVADWVGGWEANEQGRVHRVLADDASEAKLAECRQLLGSDLAALDADELAKRLEHKHREVRLRAQWELARRRATGTLTDVARKGGQIARIHAIWGLGQIGRRDPGSLVEVLVLLEDADAEVRTQAARALGDARHAAATGRLHERLEKESEPRPLAAAALALARIEDPSCIDLATRLAEAHAASDAVLRHAATRMLERCATEDQLADLAEHPSRSVRLAAVVALRRRASSRVQVFLDDPDRLVGAEAARAIHDLPLRSAYPALSEYDARGDLPTLRRVLDAHYDLGQAANARALARAAVAPETPDELRAESLEMLKTWSSPSPRDRVTGAWQPVTGERSRQDAQSALGSVIDVLLRSDTTSANALRAATELEVSLEPGRIHELLTDTARPPQARVAALDYAATRWDPSAVRDSLRLALEQSEPLLFARALRWLGLQDADQAIELSERALASLPTRPAQLLLSAIVELEGSAAEAFVLERLEDLERGQLDPALALDVLELARARDEARIGARLASLEQALAERDVFGAAALTLSGGDADAGRAVFSDGARAQCLRCHASGDLDGRSSPTVGPDLTGITSRRGKRHVLASILDPNAEIAAEFARERFVLDDESQFLGQLIRASEAEWILEGRWLSDPADSEPERLAFEPHEIVQRIPDVSGMPEGLADALTLRELRDLIAFIASR